MAVAQRVIGIPLITMIEGRIEEDKVGEKRLRRCLASLQEEVKVWRLKLYLPSHSTVEVFHRTVEVRLGVVDTILDLKDLYREDWHFATYA